MVLTIIIREYLCKISGSYGGDYEYSLLGHSAL
jgi:hypothetical protein